MTHPNYIEFRALLAEMFMLDQADLDFGIYRIMNARRDEIMRFLDHDLLPQVRDALGTIEQSDRAATEAELSDTIQQLRKFGADPEASTRVRELRRKLDDEPDVAAIENEVFSALSNFFRRYYREGDFLSLRRYKKDVYALPYEGEEVKLHWANADQYYIKSSEYFRDYSFRLADGRRVHFRLASADTEQNNNKPTPGQERRFILADNDSVAEENGELIIRFEYRADSGKRRRDAINAESSERILSTPGVDSWTRALGAADPKNPKRTILDKHLNDYTARNTFDYFIHKDLGGFLRRELDFFIKNEIMHLDDIEAETAPRVEQYLAKVRAIRRVAHKIIDFLAQLENFQKKLWLKKKFVVETNYCVTLDRVPEELYAEIAANDAQREEWVRLFAIDEIRGRALSPDYSAPLTVDFLKANPFLVLDTKCFDESFKQRLIAAFDDLDEQIDGLLVHSENFQALNLLQARYREQVKCIYIDPPYNTESEDFSYKDGYPDSTWLSMLHDRLLLGRSLLTQAGVNFASIDDSEFHNLEKLHRQVFGEVNKVGEFVVIRAEGGGLAKQVVRGHDYVLAFAKAIEDFQPLLRPKDVRGQIIEREGRQYWLETDWLRKEFGKYGNCHYEEIEEVKGLQKKLEIDKGLKDGIYQLIPSNNGLHLVARLRALDEDGSKFYSVMKHLNKDGVHELGNLFAIPPFAFPKPVSLLEQLILGCTFFKRDKDSVIFDYFAGSGTTGHAVINLNREDGGNRKYILVEMGEYFDSVTKPRIQKVIYSKDWRDGRPVSREGSSHLFKYIRLESYEDTLNNLDLQRTPTQASLLDSAPAFREDYLLRYMLDVESRGSASLLSLDHFAEPFSYQLRVAAGSAGETRPVAIDLVETFNYLLGLRVRQIATVDGARVVEGSSPDDQKILVLWRSLSQMPNDALDRWFAQQGYAERGFDVIYVNGDNTLENLRRPGQMWNVRLTEEAFRRLMFDARDV